MVQHGRGADDGLGPSQAHANSFSTAQVVHPTSHPPMTDKPKPHVCATCKRSFARLEHLKRHERSHTKEKPFACTDCTRCFARRDLLLRHQQKLHMIAPPPSKSRRRESTSSTAASGSARGIRKNSIASNSSVIMNGSMRPRANTISHVDNSTLGMVAAANSSLAHPTMGMNPSYPGPHGLPGVDGYRFYSMSTAAAQRGNPHVLPKLETQTHYADIVASLRTAPPPGGCGDVDMEDMLFGPGSTINPAQLHFSRSPLGAEPESFSPPFSHSFPGFLNGHGSLDDDANFPWLESFDQRISFNNEHAIDGSSPSAVDSGSPEAMSEMLLEGSSNPTTTAAWQNPMMPQPPLGHGYSFEVSGASFPDLYPSVPISPQTHTMHLADPDRFFAAPPPLSYQPPHANLLGHSIYLPGMSADSDTPSNSAASISSSNRQSSVTSVSTDSITDATRQALINSLSEPYGYGHGHLKTVQPQVSSPLSPAGIGKPHNANNVPLPSTYDLQRYVAAYIHYFHPHLPFLHIASLSFDSPTFASNLRASSSHPALGQHTVTGGGGALILAMAAIGALYEYEFAASKDLFEKSRIMIQLYLNERRKADMTVPTHGSLHPAEDSPEKTPLWLVQAMLLNVIYGHNCGDKKAAGIANTHCASLMSLARGADLVGPSQTAPPAEGFPRSTPEDLHMAGDDSSAWSGYISHPALDLEHEWHSWKVAEERKRTLYAIFILSSLLVSAYNCAPALMNSEIRVDLPCDESLWAADSAETWRVLGGSVTVDPNAMPFATALSVLLSAGQRQRYSHPMSLPDNGGGLDPEQQLAETTLKPSTFGCLVLINAIHNYIWETRQRQMGQQWTAQETEVMRAHIEPALRAWQAAWSSNANHSLERPNPFGASSLSADCIPLLDLAYVRLFVNLGRSKEFFFQRDFDAMAEELAHGSEIVQHAAHSPEGSPHTMASRTLSVASESSGQVNVERDSSIVPADVVLAPSPCSTQCSRRERHLRKAAFCAANSLKMSDQLNVTFADFNSRELPLQSALCAFDCAQILAEWVSTIQQRVGCYLGVLGRDEIDYGQASACLFLEQDDCKLLEKINEILSHSQGKLAGNASPHTAATMATPDGPSAEDSGFGSKILLVHANMFEKEATWPIYHEIAQALRTQAAHIKQKDKSPLLFIWGQYNTVIERQKSVHFLSQSTACCDPIMGEEGQIQSIRDRINAFTMAGKTDHLGRAPITATQTNGGTAERPSVHHRGYSINVPSSIHVHHGSNGVGNEPSGPKRDGILPPPTNIIRTGQAPQQPPKPVPPPRLPPRKQTSQPSPALPPRRPSEQMNRKASNESISSNVSSVSTLSIGNPRTNGSRASSMEVGRIKAPAFDPSSLPPLPLKRTKEAIDARYSGIEKAKAFPGYKDAERRSVSVKGTKSNPCIDSSEGKLPPTTPALPSRRPSRTEQPPPATRRLPPVDWTPPKPARAALSPTVDGERGLAATNGENDRGPGPVPPAQNRMPPPVPLSSRPNLSKLQETKPKVQPTASAPAPPVSTCLLCRDFTAVDTHAGNFPREQVPSLDWLASQLTEPFPSLTDKARAIFTWLHHNISYDTVSFFAGNIRPSTPATTLQSGLAVCEGYAALFSAIASKANLESVVVGGHGKGFGFASLPPGAALPPENPSGHAWNAVKIDNGYWKLIDCCWGAGNVSGAGLPYNKQFSPKMFTMSNVDFALRHFPGNRSHFFVEADGKTPPTWREYILGPLGGAESVRVYSGVAETEGVSETSFQPPQLKVPISPTAYPGPTVCFQFSRICEHWDPVRNGGGKPYVFVLQIGGVDGREKDFVPFETNGYFWWVNVEPSRLGCKGQTISAYTVESVDGKTGRGMTVDEYRAAKGRKGMGFGGLAAWELI
ncbi:MAG: hypothetical protein Q9163_005551 [Psora crenata]